MPQAHIVDAGVGWLPIPVPCCQLQRYESALLVVIGFQTLVIVLGYVKHDVILCLLFPEVLVFQHISLYAFECL